MIRQEFNFRSIGNGLVVNILRTTDIGIDEQHSRDSQLSPHFGRLMYLCVCRSNPELTMRKLHICDKSLNGRTCIDERK